MALKDIHLKLKAFRLRRFVVRDRRKREKGMEKRPSWMTPVSHGYQVVEDRDRSFRRSASDDESDSDSVVVQREQIQDIELWFFGVFDPRIAHGVTKYMQSHLFDKNSKESLTRRKTKEILRKAHLGVRAKIRETLKDDEAWRVGSASAMVINGCKLVMANMGGYKAVVCRDGVAHDLRSKNQQGTKRHWFRKLFSVRMLSCKSGSTEESPRSRGSRGSDLAVGTERIDSDTTEFVILASTGVWEVMKSQEAVNLIKFFEDAQEAAECLAKEALARRSRSCISCLVIRFD